MNELPATREDVVHAYRLMLGRTPDAAGLEAHLEHLRNRKPTTGEVYRLFEQSAEFRSRHHRATTFGEFELHGVKVFPWAGDDAVGYHLFNSIDYENNVIPHFTEALAEGQTVLDVGANIGIYSLLAARKVGAGGRIYAIEPMAKNVQSICRGIAGNGFQNVSVIPVAASDRSSVIGFIRSENSSDGIVDSSAGPATGLEYVPTQRMDELLHHVDRLDVIKMDIEGHEPVAWEGLKQLVSRFRPVVFTEFHPIAIRNHSRVPPETFLEKLFGHARDIDVLHRDTAPVGCRSVEAVMQEWRLANERAGLDGVMHLDLRVATTH